MIFDNKWLLNGAQTPDADGGLKPLTDKEIEAWGRKFKEMLIRAPATDLYEKARLTHMSAPSAAESL